MNKLLGVSLVVMVIANIVLIITVINLTYQAEEIIIDLKRVEGQLENLNDSVYQIIDTQQGNN